MVWTIISHLGALTNKENRAGEKLGLIVNGWLIEFVKELVRREMLNRRVLDLFPKLPEDVRNPDKRRRR